MILMYSFSKRIPYSFCFIFPCAEAPDVLLRIISNANLMLMTLDLKSGLIFNPVTALKKKIIVAAHAIERIL